ncbi:glycoside hydrolase family 3 protein [Colwellia sp. C1TZA3]|uniref:glycoside hydrolase family 3 protein n=1 Tax=Colwellia sp. C1TZA3 TaxID=2508879 RepID=UPI0011B9CEB7|nr:exo 1,3/1,4-beta-D-glucan glucohydrolase [Colwellia sp. C1TZA3]TWX65748.1 glycoside hydrolase family 3 protein [Colwellia sp. C1TZA3]
MKINTCLSRNSISYYCAALFIVVLSACSNKDVDLKPKDYTRAAHDITLWPTLNQPATKSLEVDQRVKDLLAKMTLAQKVGQMTQAEITWVTPEEVKKYHLGSVLNGGGTFLHGKRHATVQEWVNYMDVLYDASMDTSDGGLAIPMTYGIDAVHGNNKFGSATIFPHNIGLGAANNPALLNKIGKVTALEVLVTGIDWTFAPTLAVVRDDRWGRAYEGYSEDSSIVAEYAKAMTEGVQGIPGKDSFLDEHHVYATAKHWVGDGGTNNGIDQGDNILSEKDLIRLQAAAYFPSLEAGIQSIMVSHNGWYGEKLHGHKYLITDVLKGKLGFDGFVVGDWNAHANVKGCTADSCAQAVNAGIDLFMVVEDYKAFIENTIADVNSGAIPLSRIDDAVSRILRVKIRSGLFEKGRPSSRPYAGKSELMGAESHREIARQAVRESLVLLKNNKSTLPLNPNQHVLVAGDGADNMAKQAGGWTISWQGTEVIKDDFVGASTILDGIRTTVEAADGSLEYSINGEYKSKPDAAIVVFGEKPYAEWFGDVKTLAYSPYSDKDAKLLEKLKADGIPVVAVFLSGRPLWVNREINAADAFVAAWLPGSEGKAVADVLFSDKAGVIQHDFTGTLSFSWPKKASQNILNVGDQDYDPLFAYGYGLRYTDTVELAVLDTVNDNVIQLDLEAPYDVLAGKITEPWQLMMDDKNSIQYLNSSRTETDVASIMEADKTVQGDSQEFHWSGTAKATLGISSKTYDHDLMRYLGQDGFLQFDVRTIASPLGDVNIALSCNATGGYCGDIPLTPYLPTVESKEWATISIDLLCFAKKGVDFERVAVPFSLTSDAQATLRIANIRYITEKPESITVSCP